MPLLTEQDRKYILEQLNLAPDNVLADAMLAFNEIRTKIVEVRKLCGDEPRPVLDVPTVAVLDEPAERSNLNPGKPSITKIGTNTKDELFAMLNAGKQPPAKYAEHMKLLWSRGEVRFDGQEYYL